MYAADAGVQHATYEIVYDNFSQVVSPSPYDEYDFSTTYQYQVSGEVNEEIINVALQNIWVPSNIAPPTPPQAEGIIDAETLKIQSTYSGEATCRTRIEWYDDCGLDLQVKTIGIWLSSGFSYVPGSSNLEDDPMAACYPSFVELQDHMGGQVVIFRFSPAVNFFDLPDLDGDGDYHSVIIDIDYYSPDGAAPMFVSWVDTTGIPSITFAWDNASKVYHVVSVADSTDIDSHLAIPPKANLDLYEGALVSGGDIDLGKDSTVSGDIIYGGTFTHSEGFVHTDGEEINEEPQFPTQEENETFAETYKQEAIAVEEYTGTYSIGMGNGVDPVYLGPIYISGDLFVAKDNILVITGPIYVEGYIDMDKDAEFTGSGGIIAVGDIYLAKSYDFGTGGSSLIMSLNGNITFKKEAILEAVVYAPNGNIQFDKAATITGSVVAGGSITTDKDQAFTHPWRL